MFGSQSMRRIAGWISHADCSESSTKQSSNRSRTNKSRMLRMEGLEPRAMLTVASVGDMAFKEIAFNASGTVNSSYWQSGYLFHLTGTANLTGGKIKYDSPDHGVVSKSAALSVNNGTYTATQKSPNFSGSWGLSGRTLSIDDAAGQLNGSVSVGSSVMNIPTMSPVRDTFKGTYTLKNATLNAKNFDLNMDLVNGGTRINFDGTFRPAGNPFDVQVYPSWNADASVVNVDVQIPGQLHKTANRNAPVTNVKLYWANGTSFANKVSGPLADTIPVYWNEASGRYQITDLPSAPAGASHLLFVTNFDGKTRTKALALPTVSIGKVSLKEGNDPATPNVAAFKVILSRAYSQDVTVWYTTFKGAGDTAIAGSDYQFTKGSITIPTGSTEGETTIQVPIIGDTKFEPNETFSVKLTRATNAGISKTAGQSLNTILNDDSIPTIAITPRAGTFVEGNSGTKPMYFDVTLSNPSYQTVTVNFATANGTATIANKDYQAKTGTLTFLPGEVKKTISVAVIGDARKETDETFSVRLSGAAKAAISLTQGKATGTITNDDGITPPLSASRSSASKQLAGAAALSAYFDELGSSANEGAANLILAASY